MLTSDPDLPIDCFVEYLESGLFAPEDASQALSDYIHRKYRGRRIDLVIAIADPALRFVLDRRAELFPDAPIVFSGVALPATTDRSAGAGLTAVMRGTAYVETLKLALQLHPSTERVFVVAKLPDSQDVNAVRAELSDFSGRAKLTYLDEEALPRLLAAVKAVPARSLILYILRYMPDDPNSITYSEEGARLVAEVSPVPVYGTNERYVGSGVVGGVVRRNYETGARVGEIARQILKGTRAQDIPIENARLVPVVDWRQVRRWGIDPSRLPQESDIQFRTPTEWQSYRGYIIAALAVVAAQLLLIAGLLAQVAKRRRAEETIMAREATLRTSYERIRQLAGRLINAQEAARADIARNLHDDVCQQLTSLSLTVSSLKNSGNTQDSRTQQAFAQLEQGMLYLREAPASLTRTAPVDAATGRPRADIEGALQGNRGRAPCSRDPQDRGNSRHLPTDVSVCLFRIAQEALQNGLVNGKARRFVVSMRKSGEQVELTVTDDGRGFDLEAARRDGSGLGLVSMVERAHAVGAEVQVITAPGKGNHGSFARSGRRRCEYGGYSPHVDDVSSQSGCQTAV